MGMLVTWFVLLLGIGLTVFGVWALLRWHGVWGWAALVPLLLVLGVVLRIVIDVRANPTSHNLWPFEVLAGVMAAGVLLGVIALIRLGLSWHGRGRPT
jgi:hypothetical protein